MEFNDLTDEQKAKARAATSAEELATLAEEEGIELSDEQLEAVSGGDWKNKSCHGWEREGDVRADIDEALVGDEYRTGERPGDDA